MKLDSPLVSVLKRQYRLLQLKKLLGSYDVKDFNFSDLDGGKVWWMGAEGGRGWGEEEGGREGQVGGEGRQAGGREGGRVSEQVGRWARGKEGE